MGQTGRGGGEGLQLQRHGHGREGEDWEGKSHRVRKLIRYKKWMDGLGKN